MLSRFFIDRPIFATVLSVLITLTGGIALMTLPVAQYPRITPPSVQVSISYPGASAQVVADTVAAPIEQAVTGVPGMLYMSSQMGNDGTYSLSVTFDVSVNLNTALVMVQNRVTLAMPLLPTQVQNQGITIRKKTPDILCMVNFISEIEVATSDGVIRRGRLKSEDESKITLIDAKKKVIHIPKQSVVSRHSVYSDIFMSNYVLINIRDEVLRVDGVSDVSIMGQRDYSIRAWLDPQKLAARNMTAIDVQQAIQEQNIQAAPGQIGQQPMGSDQAFTLPIHLKGRLSTPEEFGDIIVKTGQPEPIKTSSALGVAAVSPGSGTGFEPMYQNGMPDSSQTIGDSTAGTSTDENLVNASISLSGGAYSGGGANTTTSSSTSGTSTGVPSTAPSKSGSMAPIAAQPKAARKPMTPPTVFAPPLPSIPIVRLKDVARIEMGALNYNISCTFDGGPSVGLGVYQLPGTNALDVAEAVRAKMKQLKKRFPDGLDYSIAYDTAPFIRESITEVFHTLRDAVFLVAIVVLFFLQDWRAMILPMIDVPVSLIGTFAVMAAMGYSLNNISLFGLVLAIGIVVDDAIVVLENIERQMARGLDTRTATIKAMEEISGPIMAITLVLCAVFVPCAFISGITGRFFTQFAVTIAASTVISAINALTMTPSRALMIFKQEERGTRGEGRGASHERVGGEVSAHALRSPEALPWWIFGLLGMVTLRYLPPLLQNSGWAERLGLPALPGQEDDTDLTTWEIWALDVLYFLPGMLAGLVLGWYYIRPINAGLGWLFRGFNKGFDIMTAGYGKTVGLSLRLSVIVLLAYGGMLFMTYYIFKISPTGFVPQQDQGRLIISVQLPDSASLTRTQEVVGQVERITRDVKGVAHTIGLCGISFVEQANAPNFGSMLVILDPFDKRQDRRLRAESIMKRLRERWAKEVTEARVVVLGAAPIPGLSVAGGFKIIVENRGGLELSTLQQQTDLLVRKLQAAQYKLNDQAISALRNANIPDGVLGKLGPMRDETFEKDSFLDELGKHIGTDRDQYKDSFLKHARQPVIGLKDVSTPFRSNTPQIFLNIDRAKAMSLGVSFNDLNATLTNYLGSLYVNSFNEFGRYWQVTIQADAPFRSRIENIYLLQVRNNRGQMVLLGSLVEAKPSTGPIFIRRYNLYTAAPITGGLLPGVSSGDVISAVDKLADQTLPLSMKTEWTELMFMQIKEGNTTGIVFGLAVVCVFLALAALYESWTLPLAVILVVPLCVLCCLIGVYFTNTSVNIFVQIGLVVLVGLACKNAILVVEFARELHAQGKSGYDATVEASRLRLRPILMTSFAFILGVVPLCIASGAGAEMRKSLGIAVFSGMLGVTLFGIFLTPVFFHVIQGIGENKMFQGNMVQTIISELIGAGVGMGTGYLIGLLGVFPIFWATILGGCAGVLGVLAVRGAHVVHKRIRKAK